MAPNLTTIQNLNQKNLDSTIKWTTFLGQVLDAVTWEGQEEATESFDYNNAISLATLTPHSIGATLPKDSVNTTLISEPFQRIADIASFDYSNIKNAKGVDQLEQQALSIGVRIVRAINNLFFNGDGLTPNLKGITNRADITINAGGAALTLDMLYELRYSAKPSNSKGLGGGPNAWFSHPRALRSLLNLLNISATTLEWVYEPVTGISYAHFLGMNWLVDENILVDAGNITEIFAVNLNHLKILYAENEEYPGNEYGIQHIPIPMQDSISEMGVLVQWTGAFQNDPGAIGKLGRVLVGP